MIHFAAPTDETGPAEEGKSTRRPDLPQNYIAPVVLGICEGPINGIQAGRYWADKDQPTADFATGVVIQQQADEGDHDAGVGPVHDHRAGGRRHRHLLADVNVYDDLRRARGSRGSPTTRARVPGPDNISSTAR